MKSFLKIYYIFFSLPLFAQISPGDLTEAHKYLEGIWNCTQCHELGEDVTNFKCLNCHSHINNSIEMKTGFHSSAEVISKKCYTCHSEHHGRNFDIIRFDHDEFEHSKTGFKLTGKHLEVECEDCHKPDLIQMEELKENSGTFLGLSQNCHTCHEDYHQGTLGINCTNCHTTETFKHASKFNHDSAMFILAGAHQKVECENCHKVVIRNNKNFQVFVGLQFNQCTDCHEDIHRGKFGNNCESCHSTISFKQIKNIEQFDHSKTNFPLVGQHQFVACRDCHKASLSSKPNYKKCIDCHDDFHKGEFTINNNIRDCSECHTEESFLPSTFTLELHRKTDFPLTGSHLAVQCTSCHIVQNDYRFEFTSFSCIECHENIHKGKMSNRFLSDQTCEGCHNTVLWSDIKFDHDRTDFELRGKHSEINCTDCHFRNVNNKFIQEFQDLSQNCEDCHNDIHFNQFDISGLTDCSRCHGFNNWEPVYFDHSKTEFPLDGKHADVKCKECHKEIQTPVGKFLKYKFEETKCINCHSS